MLVSSAPISSIPISSEPLAGVVSELPCPYIPARVDQSGETTSQPATTTEFAAALDSGFSFEIRAEQEPYHFARDDQSPSITAKIDDTSSPSARIDEETAFAGKPDESTALVNLPVEESSTAARADNSFEFYNRAAQNDLVESAGRTDECR